MDDDVRIRCRATTKSGAQCKKYATDGASYCHIHQRQTKTAVPPTTQSGEEMQRLVRELDELVAQLKASVPESPAAAFSPLRLVTLIRENVPKLPPEIGLGILENFEGMTAEDLKDIDTWKGMAYMLSYSARFQAGQARDRMNEHLPSPMKPDNIIQFVKKNMDKFAPGMAKDILANFEGATKEDFLDPDTWKGVWTMLDYSLRFQLEEWKNKLAGEEGGE